MAKNMNIGTSKTKYVGYSKLLFKVSLIAILFTASNLYCEKIISFNVHLIECTIAFIITLKPHTFVITKFE